MAEATSIVLAIDFVEENLGEDITIADVAEATGYSLYHFCRVFTQATHHPPYDYLIRRRLSQAAQDLLASERRIIDVALDYQFSTPETFSRAFKRLFGIQASLGQQSFSMPSAQHVEIDADMGAVEMTHVERRFPGCLDADENYYLHVCRSSRKSS